MSQLLTINLSKSPGASWGFRLQGGKDFATPLCVQKVNMGSIAEKAGLQAADAIVSIGGQDALSFRHKDAQDAIVRAGNNFQMLVQRGGTSIWRPQVTALPQAKKTNMGPVATKTSLAATPKKPKPVASGFNTAPIPFGEINGQQIVNAQYNSPLPLYSEDAIAETLSAQAEVLGKGCLGINFKKFDKEVQLRTDSPTYQMIHGHDVGSTSPYKPRQQLPLEESVPEPQPVFPAPQPGQKECHSVVHHAAPGSGPAGVRSVRAPANKPATNTGGQQVTTKCAECERPIIGVFVRIKNKSLHAECFKCATCGSSLKNVGYYNINEKLYCEIHAKQAARHNPPAANMEPVTVKPGAPVPLGAVPAAAASMKFPSAAAPAPAPLPAPAPVPIPSSVAPPHTFAPSKAPAPAQQQSANFGAPVDGLDVRSHIPKKGAAPTPAVKQAPITGSGSGMPKPTPMPNMGGAGKPPGSGPVKGIPGERTRPRRGRGTIVQPTASRIPICGHCQRQIRGPFVTALGKTWCPDHFLCATESCRCQLIDMGFVEEQGQLYCENCYEKYLAPICGKCDRRIKGDCLNAVGKQFHPECFCCAYCGKVFGSGAFYLEDGLPYCETDWNDLFTTKCVGCGFPIEAGDRWVEALNNNYHSQCFKCSKCHKNLEGQSFFAKGGKPFCKAHAQRGF